MKRQFGGRGLEAVGSPKFFRARHAPLAGAVTVHTVDALMHQLSVIHISATHWPWNWIKYRALVYACPVLDHIFIRLGHVPPTARSLPSLLAHTCVGTLPRWELMWQYPVKITNIQVDITSIIPQLIDGVPSHEPYGETPVSQIDRGLLDDWFGGCKWLKINLKPTSNIRACIGRRDNLNAALISFNCPFFTSTWALGFNRCSIGHWCLTIRY